MENTSVKIMQCKAVKSGRLTVDCIGVGVGMVLFDSANKIGVGLHVLAPRSADPFPSNPAKYADSGVAYAVELLTKEGGGNPVVAIAGGAAMEGSSAGISMGAMVVESVKNALSRVNLKVSREDTGGSKIRSIVLDIDTGEIRFK